MHGKSPFSRSSLPPSPSPRGGAGGESQYDLGPLHPEPAFHFAGRGREGVAARARAPGRSLHPLAFPTTVVSDNNGGPRFRGLRPLFLPCTDLEHGQFLCRGGERCADTVLVFCVRLCGLRGWMPHSSGSSQGSSPRGGWVLQASGERILLNLPKLLGIMHLLAVTLPILNLYNYHLASLNSHGLRRSVSVYFFTLIFLLGFFSSFPFSVGRGEAKL